MIPETVPEVVFHTRVRNPELPGDNPFEWQDITTSELFSSKKVVVFGLPGAYTPACSDSHLPGYEALYPQFIDAGIDAVVCVSVNDAFVMFQWGKSQNINNVVMLPDGNADFTRRMGMLVDRASHGMGMRSWRYSMLVDNRRIAKVFSEPDIDDNPPGVPLSVSAAQSMLDYIRNN